jgi:hypothetical protein
MKRVNLWSNPPVPVVWWRAIGAVLVSIGLVSGAPTPLPQIMLLVGLWASFWDAEWIADCWEEERNLKL